jgi:hypothetical protein
MYAQMSGYDKLIQLRVDREIDHHFIVTAQLFE